MSAISELLLNVEINEPQIHNNLAMFPLMSAGNSEPRYLLLDEALERGYARVTEVSESGSVPELKFVNECDQPIFLLDGEELVGAKQNRILNLSVLAPAHKTIVIPVSCVEAGRWNAQSSEFASAKRAHFAAGRARKLGQVSDSLRMDGSRRSNQSEVWNDISEKSARMDSHSGTQAAAALYETHRASLDEYLNAFSALQNQSGALFAINGEIIGLDIFDNPSTLAKLLPKLVQSFALDAIDVGKCDSSAVGTDAGKLLEEVSRAAIERFPAVGEGEDLRLQGNAMTGGALVSDNKVIHLCAFRTTADNRGGKVHHSSRMACASSRRNSRNQ